MTTRFWLAAFEPAAWPSVAADGAPLPLTPSPDAPANAIAIEVWRDGAEVAVFVSLADAADAPRTLACRMCFANATTICDQLRSRGFPAIESRVDWDAQTGVMRLFTPFFADGERMAQPPRDPILVVGGVRFDDTDAGDALDSQYHQTRMAPARVCPDSRLAVRPAAWRIARRVASRPTQRVTLVVEAAAARYPCLDPLPRKGAVGPDAFVWSGVLGDDETAPAKGLAERVRRLPHARGFGGPTRFRPRTDAFVAPAYRFDDVEVIGFRIELDAFGDGADALLSSLVEPLNFHLAENRGGMNDFRYRAASRTLMIELLRYGDMRLDRATPPLSTRDTQSQHELLVRIIVGAVDDSTAQAHDPATFVPAIFVDNPWSRLLGREVQGFDKRLAAFCCLDRDTTSPARERPLNPDGRLPDCAPDDPPQPLARVAQVRLVQDIDGGTPAGIAFLSLEYDPQDAAEADAFVPVEETVALVNSSFFGAQWRQDDFDAVEFRRSFARSVFADSVMGFRSIQVSPIDARGLDKAWITGRFGVRDIRVAFPAGIARLTLRSDPSAPAAWNRICDFLSEAHGDAAEIELSTGEWYRMRCSTDLRIDDGPVDLALEW